MNGIIDQLINSPEFKNAVSVNKGNFIQNQPNSGIVAPNTSQQQGFQQQALGQMGQLASQAGQIAPAQSSGMSPISLANALRNKGAMDNVTQSANAYMPWTQMNIANQYATDPYSEQSRMLAMQERGF